MPASGTQHHRPSDVGTIRFLAARLSPGRGPAGHPDRASALTAKTTDPVLLCFISYSSQDQEFAKRLHADLQDKGVRCWFDKHDMPIGAKILDTLEKAIQHQDKVLLILSEGAIASDWV